MNTLSLKYAVEVEKTGSITQAADNLFMGQPNLSKAIKELETGLGIAIFNRTSKGVVPTLKGKEFLNHAKNILLQIDEIESLYNPNDKGKLTFSISAVKTSYLTDAFVKFINTFDTGQEFDINIRETNSIETINNVYMNEYKLGVIRYQTTYERYFMDLLAEKDIKVEQFWDFEFSILLSQDHPLAEYDQISYQSLADYVEVVYCDLTSPSLSLPDLKKMSVSDHMKKIYVYEGGSQFDILSKVGKTYMWDSPLPPEFLDRYGLVQRKCSLNNNRYVDALIYPQRYRLTNLDETFINILSKVQAEILTN